MDSRRNVAVIGLGAIGSMALLSLARRGANVVGFEQFTPGHDGSAFGGGTRRFRLATPGGHGAQHIALAAESLRLWSELELAAHTSLYISTGELGVGPIDDPEIASLVACLRSAGLDHDVISPADLARRFPQHVLADDEVGVHSVDGGVLRSNRGVKAAVEVAERLGATVHTHSRVEAIAPVPGGVTITANGERHTVDHAVITTGPWVRDLLPTVRAAVITRQIVTTWFEPGPDGSFAPTTFPSGFRRSRSNHSYTFLPAVDSTAAKFIFWIPMRPVIADPSSAEHRYDQQTVESTCRALATTMRSVGPTPSRVEPYMEGFTPDRWPVVGRVCDEISVLAGFSGAGFAIAPVMGEVAADLALEGSTTRDIAGMSLSRFEAAAAPASQPTQVDNLLTGRP